MALQPIYHTPPGFAYQHTFKLEEGVIQPPQLEPVDSFENQRNNEMATLMYEKLRSLNQEISSYVKDSANLDQVRKPRPEPQPQAQPEQETVMATNSPAVRPRGWLSRFFGRSKVENGPVAEAHSALQSSPAQKQEQPVEATEKAEATAPEKWGYDEAPLSGEVKLSRYGNHAKLSGHLLFNPDLLQADTLGVRDGQMPNGLISGNLLAPDGERSSRMIAIESKLAKSDIFKQSPTTEFLVHAYSHGTPPIAGPGIYKPPGRPWASLNDKIVVDWDKNSVTLFTNKL